MGRGSEVVAHLVKRVTKSSPNQDATRCYAFDSDGSPPPIAGSPHNGTLEAPLPPVRGFFIFTQGSGTTVAAVAPVQARRLRSADAFASFSTSEADLS